MDQQHATTAMMFPIGISLLAVLERHEGRSAPGFATALLLSNALAASIGGLATPVGTPPNLIGIGSLRREAGYDVSFFTWMALGVPVVALLMSWMVFDLVRRRLRGPVALSGVTSWCRASSTRSVRGPGRNGIPYSPSR